MASPSPQRPPEPAARGGAPPRPTVGVASRTGAGGGASSPSSPAPSLPPATGAQSVRGSSAGVGGTIGAGAMSATATDARSAAQTLAVNLEDRSKLLRQLHLLVGERSKQARESAASSRRAHRDADALQHSHDEAVRRTSDLESQLASRDGDIEALQT